ncbi:hypothetical protein DPMN_127779 [Dreissena polymorpha]|uniref:Uncharacterized protein n=1 Tax=Dreissena polymorpha TaxID=45954 RepID=A0A9D4GZJ8_DREPO|nr:hypothetical protein DPMN_127779 [Dreissena polymorpha]
MYCITNSIPIRTQYKLHVAFVRDINKTNFLTKFHDDLANIMTSRVFTRKTAPPTGGHVFQRTGTTFELNQHIIKTNILTKCLQGFFFFKLDRGIIGTNLLTKFHEDRTRTVASRVFTMKTAPPTGGHVFQWTGTTFELNQHISIIGTKLLTKFHEDRTRNVPSKSVYKQMWKDGRTDDGQRPITKAHLSNQMS